MSAYKPKILLLNGFYPAHTGYADATLGYNGVAIALQQMGCDLRLVSTYAAINALDLTDYDGLIIVGGDPSYSPDTPSTATHQAIAGQNAFLAAHHTFKTADTPVCFLTGNQTATNKTSGAGYTPVITGCATITGTSGQFYAPIYLSKQAATAVETDETERPVGYIQSFVFGHQVSTPAAMHDTETMHFYSPRTRDMWLMGWRAWAGTVGSSGDNLYWAGYPGQNQYLYGLLYWLRVAGITVPKPYILDSNADDINRIPGSSNCIDTVAAYCRAQGHKMPCGWSHPVTPGDIVRDRQTTASKALFATNSDVLPVFLHPHYKEREINYTVRTLYISNAEGYAAGTTTLHLSGISTSIYPLHASQDTYGAEYITIKGRDYLVTSSGTATTEQDIVISPGLAEAVAHGATITVRSSIARCKAIYEAARVTAEADMPGVPILDHVDGYIFVPDNTLDRVGAQTLHGYGVRLVRDRYKRLIGNVCYVDPPTADHLDSVTESKSVRDVYNWPSDTAYPNHIGLNCDLKSGTEDSNPVMMLSEFFAMIATTATTKSAAATPWYAGYRIQMQCLRALQRCGRFLVWSHGQQFKREVNTGWLSFQANVVAGDVYQIGDHAYEYVTNAEDAANTQVGGTIAEVVKVVVGGTTNTSVVNLQSAIATHQSALTTEIYTHNGSGSIRTLLMSDPTGAVPTGIVSTPLVNGSTNPKVLYKQIDNYDVLMEVMDSYVGGLVRLSPGNVRWATAADRRALATRL